MPVVSLARFCAALLVALTFAMAGRPALADTAPNDPAAKQIASFTDTLLDSMRQAKELGVMGRFNKLKPIVEQTFDLPTMTRLAIGASWTALSPSDQQALVAAFERMTIANYARNFDGYNGEKFTIDPNVQTRGEDRLVQTTLVSPHDAPVPFIYRMRDAGGGAWKVIDVYLNGYVSELATRRSDFSSTVASGGPDALLKRINSLSDKLLSGA